MKQSMKRLISLILCFVMVMGLMPVFVLNADAAGTVLDAAIFCSDVHGSTSDLTSVLSGVKTSGVDYSSIGFVGDTCLTVANTTSTVQSALGDTDIDVMFSYASSHDTEDGADIDTDWDYSGEVAGVSDYYLVYTIRETDMQYSSNANTASAAFTTWYNGLTAAQKKLPIFVMSHRPIHARRGGNQGGEVWTQAFNAAGATSDIVVFWAHNHTGETTVDTGYYHVEKGGTVNVATSKGSSSTANESGTGTDYEIAFTYMNAGYINANDQNPKRLGVATTVQITADSLIFQDYNSSGTYTDATYSHNTTVTRDAVAAEAVTLSSIAISGTTEYTVGDELDLTVTAAYSDGTTADVTSDAAITGYDMNTAGTQTVTATYEGQTATTTITVVEAETTEPSTEATEPSTEATEPSTEATEPSTEATEPSTEATEPSELTDGVESDATVPGYDNTVTTTVWQLTDTITSGNTYLIVNTNAASTSAHAMGHSGTTVADDAVVVYNDGTNTYILDSDVDSTSKWTFEGSSGSWEPKNGDYYLTYTFDSSSSIFGTTYSNFALAVNTTAYTWATDGDNLYFTKGTGNAYGLSYSSGWTLGAGDYSWGSGYSYPNVYFYTPTTITTGTVVPETTYHMDLTVDGNTVSDNAYTVTGVVSGTTAAMNAVFTATAEGSTTTMDGYPANGSFTVLSSSNTDVATIGSDGTLTFTGKAGVTRIQVEYTWTENGQTYTTRNYVDITAQTPVYDMAIADPESNQMKIGATTTLTASITADGTATTGTVTWSTSDESIATVDAATGVVTGVAAGDVTITATYTDPNGNVHEDSVKLEVLEAVYTLDICKKVTDEEGNESFESITKPVVIKEVTAGMTHSVWAVITKDGVDLGTLSTDTTQPDNISKLAFYSSNEAIATVDKTTGVVTFTGEEGTVQITAVYTYADGKSVTDTVTFSVSKGSYMIPSDGTKDFPTYPEEGAIRFDKTAVAQGNFSATGIAKVELSMTGVPYTTGNAIDALLVLDMSTSMKTEVATDTTRYDVTATATKAFIKAIVQNDDGSYNDNTVCVHYFNGTTAYTDNITDGFITISSDEELETVYAAIENLAANPPSSSGTDYSTALETAYNTIIARDAESDNTQALVFMSDGGPTYYTYLNDSGTGTKLGSSGSNGGAGSTIVSWFDTDDNGTSSDETDDTATPNSSFKQEYYTYLLKNAEPPYPVYTVGLGLAENSTGPSAYTGLTSGVHEAITSYILSSMATNSSYFYNVADEDAVADMGNIFSGIAASIKEAATDVVVEDKIEEHYTMNFKLPNTGVTADEAGMSEFYIQVVDYILDSTTHERTGNYSVLENITFNADGSVKSHTVDGAACGDTCSHVTFTDGTVTAIDGTYFDYTIDANGDEFLHWNAEKLTSTELALQYFVYLDESAGYAAEDQVDAGTYNTNEYATITYTNYLGNKCQQYFPIPSQTWMGAQVTYVFYLVNEDGEPVNRAGVVVPFAEAVYVTTPITYDVTWNEAEGVEKLDAAYLAKDKVPEVYALYDNDAYYEILVYQTEGVDSETSAKNYNHFIIEGSSTVTNKETTKVFNTKAGTKFEDYGAYSATAGSYTSTNSGKSYTATVTTDIDYANTTVAFAVVWKPELVPDVVVVDYGLDVVIDVTTNDSMASTLVGVRASAPAGVTINKGEYTAAKASSVDLYIDANNDSDSLKELKLGTATVDSLTSVRFSLDKTNGMQFSDAAEFFYESEVNYYDDNNQLVTASMYSSVTVIPATTIYYEDNFVTLTKYTTSTEIAEDGTEKTVTTAGEWDVTSVTPVAGQSQDRPGASKISKDLDADNNYGYDNAYVGMSQHSMGSSAKIVVDANSYGTAQFSFYGTGFDVISLTSYATGNIVVNVTGGPENIKKYYFVDTFYGYARGDLLYNTYTYTDGEWKFIGSETVADPDAVGVSQIGDPILPAAPEEGTTVYAYEYEWIVVDSNDPNALYQVPVMKVKDLAYGKYTVTITASYVADYDHVAGSSSYDFYLDAIRIYDPANDGANNETIKDAYVEDGEYLPEYYELRNWLISAETFASLTVDDVSEGIVFIDGAISDGTTVGAGATNSVTDYSNYGPNNELYLAPGQAVAFDLGANVAAPAGYAVDTVQIAYKSVDGTAKAKIWDVGSGVKVADAEEKTVDTATDLYYDITELNGKTVVIMNSGTASDAILSITNVKVTFKEATSTASELQTISDTLMVSRIGTSPLALTAAAETTAEEETTITAPFTVTAAGVASAIAAMSVELDETEPEETEPETTEPEETEPETTEPEETEPETTEPEETEPETTEPETTEPEETEPETTEPEETEPETTEPEETEPEDGTGDGGIWDLIEYVIRLLGMIFG